MTQIHVVGVGLDPEDLTQIIAKRIAKAQVLVGGTRLLDRFKDHPGLKLPIKSPLDEIITRVEQEMLSGKEVVVLADGDPGFFGIGKRLVAAIGKENLRFYPNVCTLQAAAARLKISWEDIRSISLHGRKDLSPLFRALVRHDRVGVFTDKDSHPGRLAGALVDRGVDTFLMHVFEDLGQKGERIGSFEIQEVEGKSFSPLNFVLLERKKHPEIALHLGMDENFYIHEKGLVTKREIRAAGLSMLEVRANDTVWDLGSGCGSVAIEASLLATEGRILAVEKNPSRCESIRLNIRRTGAYGVELIQGQMPGCLEALGDPDRVFIGGGTRHGSGVLEEVVKRLKPGGKMVVHVVLIGSLHHVREVLLSHGWPFTITQIQVSRSQSLAGDLRLEALNPVYIISAVKPAG
jgi:precorrin-6B C5,15-methyltransferase / cobalt-precorrin-6B C5,C15-methyltransferase